uniref:Glycogen-binding subunit 76A n=1 Tax=Schistocephalus solidus TaxID=70667 RepID=A0A0V0J954_SCHSO
MRKPESQSRGEVVTHRSPFTRFFASLWARIRFLFTAAISEACDCSNHPKNNARSRSPSNVSFTKDGDVVDAKVIAATNIPENEPLINSCNSPHDSTPAESLHREYRTNEAVADTPLDNLSLGEADCPDTVVCSPQSHLVHSEHLLPDRREVLVVGEVRKVITLPVQSEAPSEYTEVIFREEHRPESVCHATVGIDEGDSNPHVVPVTLMSVLHQQLKNGEISVEEHQEITESIVQSTIPRNLSDSQETRKPIGVSRLYAWQPPPLEINTAEEQDVMERSSEFVDELISVSLDAVNKPTTEASPKHATIVPPTGEESKMLAEEAQLDDEVFERRADEADDEGDEEEEEEEEEEDNSEACRFRTLRDVEKLLHSTPLSSSAPATTVEVNLSETDETADILPPPPASPDYDGIFRYYMDVPITDLNQLRTKRSSSLKSEHSPLSTPCRKIVRFADALGLDLATVRQVLDQENPPKIPASATLDLNLDLDRSLSSQGAKQFQLCFAQPSASNNFLNRVLRNNVVLEGARVDSSRGLLTGTIRVKSLGFEKHVSVRITYNDWATFCDLPTNYVQDSHDGVTDRFSFCAIFPSTVVANEKVQFAIRYETHTGEVFWDNNLGENYIIVCHAKATDMAGDGSWVHFL